jgi:hypothetical protein
VAEALPSSARGEIQHRTSGLIGSLYRKRLLPKAAEASQEIFGNMDWALYTINKHKIRLSNTLILPGGSILDPKIIAQDDPTDTEVLINTCPTGLVKGYIIGDYSLVALPGTNYFQRM